MEDNSTPQVDSKHALASKTIIGVLVVILPTILNLLGVKLGEADLQATVGDIVQILGAALAIYGRFTAVKPVTVLPAPKAGASAVLLFAFVGASLLNLTGCATTSDATKAKWSATGSWLLTKAEQIALSTVVSAAQSQADASAKADWMDSLATGLRTSAVASFSGDDVRTLIGIWTPDKPHWQDLGAQLADLSKQALLLPPDERNEALAQALNLAAQAARAMSPTAFAGALQRGALTTDLGGPLRIPFRLDVDRMADLDKPPGAPFAIDLASGR